MKQDESRSTTPHQAKQNNRKGISELMIAIILAFILAFISISITLFTNKQQFDSESNIKHNDSQIGRLEYLNTAETLPATITLSRDSQHGNRNGNPRIITTRLSTNPMRETIKAIYCLDCFRSVNATKLIRRGKRHG